MALSLLDGGQLILEARAHIHHTDKHTVLWVCGGELSCQIQAPAASVHQQTECHVVDHDPAASSMNTVRSPNSKNLQLCYTALKLPTKGTLDLKFGSGDLGSCESGLVHKAG